MGGQDATEAFEDVGHSDEAREILDGLLVGTLKRQVSYNRSFFVPYRRTELTIGGYTFTGRRPSSQNLRAIHRHRT